MRNQIRVPDYLCGVATIRRNGLRQPKWGRGLRVDVGEQNCETVVRNLFQANVPFWEGVSLFAIRVSGAVNFASGKFVAD